VLGAQVRAALGEIKGGLRSQLIRTELISREKVEQEVLVNSTAALVHDASTGSGGTDFGGFGGGSVGP
jgi:hypothetical protein